MGESSDQGLQDRALALAERHWKWLVLLTWLGFCAWFLFNKWASIQIFALGDTDDNMRMMQVRGLLNGQDWYDLRQHRLSPPFGANMHWSRLVDLPIAGLILAFRPLLGGPGAERWAVAIAPLLPYLLLLFSLALTTRRLVDKRAYPIAFLALFFAGSTNGMYMPLRIDHHGWQLALLALSISAVADPKRLRGGITLGLSTALSLSIGLEMIIYLAIAASVTVLSWVQDGDERERLGAYALSLSAGTSLAFLIFASYDNRHPVCDALSPVWLSNAMIGSALLYLLSRLSPGDWRKRLALAAGAGVIIAGFHAAMWPQCLSRLEGVSPEVRALWLDNVKEARPIYRHGWRIATTVAALPIAGAIGWAVLAWASRGDPARQRRVLGAAVIGISAALLLLWQSRTGPAAQMVATIGAAALVWIVLPLAWKSKSSLARIFGSALVVVAGVGAAVPLALNYIPDKPSTPRQKAIGRANQLCASLWGMRPIARQPKGTVFTFVDLGPRLITITHHDAVIGPYHRNGEQIGDVMTAFRGSAEQARRIIAKYDSDYLLSCPDSSTTTIFMAEAPKGFYGQLERGQVPDWLVPIELPTDSPFKMWRVVR